MPLAGRSRVRRDRADTLTSAAAFTESSVSFADNPSTRRRQQLGRGARAYVPGAKHGWGWRLARRRR